MLKICFKPFPWYCSCKMPSIDTGAFLTKVVLSQDTGQTKVKIKLATRNTHFQIELSLCPPAYWLCENWPNWGNQTLTNLFNWHLNHIKCLWLIFDSNKITSLPPKTSWCMNTFLQKMKSEIFFLGGGRVRGDVTTFFFQISWRRKFWMHRKKGLAAKNANAHDSPAADFYPARALGLLLAYSVPTVGWGKIFWLICRFFFTKTKNKNKNGRKVKKLIWSLQMDPYLIFVTDTTDMSV